MNKQPLISACSPTDHEDTVNKLRLALDRMLKMHNLMIEQTNIGASFYDADCIREMNEAPIQAHDALMPVDCEAVRVSNESGFNQ